jgi:hypothetical protein
MIRDRENSRDCPDSPEQRLDYRTTLVVYKKCMNCVVMADNGSLVSQ